jgi:hypothetical protein
MPTHNIIDNRDERLVDHIQAILPNTKSAKFAVGYFFLSGLEALGTSLDTIGELRLLIGNTSNRETIEQLSEAYKRLDQVQEEADKLRFARRADLNRQAGETAGNLRDAVGLMDQTDEAEELVHSLVRMVGVYLRLQHPQPRQQRHRYRRLIQPHPLRHPGQYRAQCAGARRGLDARPHNRQPR